MDQENVLKGPITDELIERMNKYWRTANYLSAAQLYLLDNPLLRKPLQMSDIKKRIVGHWGTVPGQNFIVTHLNREIVKNDLDMILISGPGHGGNFFIANDYIDGSYTDIYPEITKDEKGLQKLFKQFSFPGGVPSHCAPETPGSINEGGELGYGLAHGFGAILDNPDLIAAVIVGDGEAETGPMATSWQCNKFLDPIHDGAVLPIFHLNGYKIANPTVYGRMSDTEIRKVFEGLGWKPYFVEGDDPLPMHRKMAEVMDQVIEDIQKIQNHARKTGDTARKPWPMIVLRSPKGWTGPKIVDGLPIEGTFRAHQVPLTMDGPTHLPLLEAWLRSYKPEELFEADGSIKKEITDLCPKGDRRFGKNPHANGGLLRKGLVLPNVRNYAFPVTKPGFTNGQDMIEFGKYSRDIIKDNAEERNFRIFGPDETLSNRLNAVFEATNRQWEEKVFKSDDFLSSDGRVIDSMLSEHMDEGWLEGYLLTGRHGYFASYEAFARVVDSMVGQHAKWLKTCRSLPWRAPISSLNIILSSIIFQQDHNGYTHQDPGFLNALADKKASVMRFYMPVDSNTMICTMNHVLSTKNRVNVVVASKQPRPQWYTMEEAIALTKKGADIVPFGTNDEGKKPDIVLAFAGVSPMMETLFAADILHSAFPKLKIRCINVIDLFKLEPKKQHPHGLTEEGYEELFTKDSPILFNFHGYPSLIKQFTYDRVNRPKVILGYQEEGTITTPFDMRVLNGIDRFDVVKAALSLLPRSDESSKLIADMDRKLAAHRAYILKNGLDMPEIENAKFVPINK